MKKKDADLIRLKRMLSAQYANACRRGDKEQAELLKRTMGKIKL